MATVTKKANKPAVKTSAPTPAKKNLPTVQSTKSKAIITIDDFEGGEGFENVSASDVLLPRINILQSNADQLKRNKPLFIKDASPGDFCDLALNKVLPTPLPLIPCFYAVVYIQWGPRESDRGLVMNHGTDPSILKKARRDENNRMVLPNGDYIAETATFFVLYQNEDGDWIPAFLPLSSTQLKNAKRWNTSLKAERVKKPDGTKFMPHMYYRAWLATVKEESNAKGDWFGWSFEPGDTIIEIDPSKELLAAAKEFYHQAKVGLVRGDVEGAAREQQNDGDVDGDGDGRL